MPDAGIDQDYPKNRFRRERFLTLLRLRVEVGGRFLTRGRFLAAEGAFLPLKLKAQPPNLRRRS